MRSIEHTPAELVVAEAVLAEREMNEINRSMGRNPRAVKPIVQAKTGASDDLYWRGCRIANANEET